MQTEQLQELLLEQIRDLYDAEKQLVKALPKLAKAASSEELAEAFRSHLEETKNHVARLEQVFESVDSKAKGKTCKAMQGLVEEGSEVIEEHDKGILRDLAMIAAAQRVEHYEISAYGTARSLAETISNSRAAKLLKQTEQEESAADSKLTKIAGALYQEEPSEEEEETVNAR